jgi:hypothetical protein
VSRIEEIVDQWLVSFDHWSPPTRHDLRRFGEVVAKAVVQRMWEKAARAHRRLPMLKEQRMIPVASKPCICDRNERGCIKWKIECEACAAGCDDPPAAPPKDWVNCECGYDGPPPHPFPINGRCPLLAAPPIDADLLKRFVEHDCSPPDWPGTECREADAENHRKIRALARALLAVTRERDEARTALRETLQDACDKHAAAEREIAERNNENAKWRVEVTQLRDCVTALEAAVAKVPHLEKYADTGNLYAPPNHGPGGRRKECAELGGRCAFDALGGGK